MSFGSKVRRPSKVRTLEVSEDHLMQHLHSFMLASGLIARDEVIADYIFPRGQSTVSSYINPNYIYVKLKKVKNKNEEG